MAYCNSHKNFAHLQDSTSVPLLSCIYKDGQRIRDQETFAVVFLYIDCLLLKTADKTFQYVNKGSQQLPLQ